MTNVSDLASARDKRDEPSLRQKLAEMEAAALYQKGVSEEYAADALKWRARAEEAWALLESLGHHVPRA